VREAFNFVFVTRCDQKTPLQQHMIGTRPSIPSHSIPFQPHPHIPIIRPDPTPPRGQVDVEAEQRGESRRFGCPVRPRTSPVRCLGSADQSACLPTRTTQLPSCAVPPGTAALPPCQKIRICLMTMAVAVAVAVAPHRTAPRRARRPDPTQPSQLCRVPNRTEPGSDPSASRSNSLRPMPIPMSIPMGKKSPTSDAGAALALPLAIPICHPSLALALGRRCAAFSFSRH